MTAMVTRPRILSGQAVPAAEPFSAVLILATGVLAVLEAMGRGIGGATPR